MEINAQNKLSDRQPVAAGRFYSSNKETLKKDISSLLEDCKKNQTYNTVRAIIAPHAGYAYSGKTAAAGYSVIPRDAIYKNIFLIGSSHVMAFEGASVYNLGDYITPLGKALVNKEIANMLIKENDVFNYPITSHVQEHSLEVQVPFIQSYFKKIPTIVPIIIGTDNEQTIKQISDALLPWFTNENLFIISSDFSHYPPYKEAVIYDNLTATAITSGNPQTFLTTLKKNSDKKIKGLVTSMCGWSSCLALLYMSEKNSSLQYIIVDYCNSGDSQFGGKEEVVGYYAIALTENDQNAEVKKDAVETLSFSEKEKSILFSLVRSNIQSRLTGKIENLTDTLSIPDKLKEHYGAFVTLKINGKLRGCIGRFMSSEPLYDVVKVSALSSAFEDPRFSPVTKEEYEKTEIEITVLGPLKKINNINEIVLGRHGLYIKKGLSAGTMLPQVATENGWSVVEFLGYTSRDKAGLGWDGWKDAEIFIYEGIVIEEI